MRTPSVGYLHQAAAVLAGRPDAIDDGPTGLPADFEHLRWFPLPPTCLPDYQHDPTAVPC